MELVLKTISKMSEFREQHDQVRTAGMLGNVGPVSCSEKKELSNAISLNYRIWCFPQMSPSVAQSPHDYGGDVGG